VSLDAVAVDRFNRFRGLLLMWNERHNLTAIRDPEGVEQRLILDALALVPDLDRVVSALPESDTRRSRLVDIGSGAGFPGLALKIARPQLDVTLVDATAKKVSFLDAAINELDLSGARAIHARAEALGQDPGFRGQFGVATARAVAALPVLLEYCIPLLEVGGAALLPKGLRIEDELRAGRLAAPLLGAEIVSALVVPPGQTRLVIARKTRPTPSRYPRRIGLPSQEPLGGKE
jgi:16S rRNA (guanine527-N7)-methyltransferase